MRDRRRGVALILVLGVLFVLSTLAVTLVRTTAMERDAATHAVLATRARALAESGVTLAVERLRALAEQTSYDAPDAGWRYPVRDAPLETAAETSWPGLTLDGGRMRLRVLDCASQIDVNAWADDGRRAQLAGMIDRLWRWRLEERSLSGRDGLGRYLMSLGPFGTSARLERAVAAFDPALGAEAWRIVGPYLTLRAWRDPTVLRPQAAARGGWGRRQYASLTRQARAPVNANTAPWPVLAAVFAGLRARYARPARSDELRGSQLAAADRLEEVAIDEALARRLARRLVARRTGQALRSWDDLEAWIAGEVRARVLDAAQGDLLRAMVFPDAQLQAFNPDANGVRLLDKTDLVAWTTELCLSSMGYFEIDCVGQVLERDVVHAEARVETLVRVFDVVVETTYDDFARGELRRAIVRPGVGPDAPGRLRDAHPLAARAQAFAGQVGIAPKRADVDRACRWVSDFAAPGDGPGLHPLSGPLVGEAPRGTRLVDGAYSERAGGLHAHPEYRRAARWAVDRGAICFWYKPRWDPGALRARPRSILTLGGSAADATCQLYFARGTDRVVPGGGGGPRLVLVVWDRANRREHRAEVPLVRGETLLARRGEWLHVALFWDPTKVVVCVRGRYGDGRVGAPKVQLDATGEGGPLVLSQPVIGGVLALVHLVVNEKVQRPGGPPARLALPLVIAPSRLTLGGPLKRRPAGAAVGPDPPPYSVRLCPSEGTYAKLHSFVRGDLDLSPANQSSLFVNPGGTLPVRDRDHLEVERIYLLGRYHNSAGAADAPRYRSRVIDEARGHALGTISWRALRTPNTGVLVRVLRRRGGKWELVPDGKQRLAFAASGAASIARSVVDVGLRPRDRFGPLRYEVLLTDIVARRLPLLESPLLESVAITVLTPPRVLEWWWR